jgi:hypothetical protein
LARRSPPRCGGFDEEAQRQHSRRSRESVSSYAPKLRGKLSALRSLILKTATKTEGVGPLEEALKWGQASFLTVKSGSGSTIRIDRMKNSDEKYALYFHCQTGLVPAFRELYPEKFEFSRQPRHRSGCEQEARREGARALHRARADVSRAKGRKPR